MNEKDHRVDDYFMKYRNLVIRNICLFVDYHTAEDLCQETFIRLAERLDDLKPEKVKSWLLVVSENLAVDHLRKGGQYTIILGLDIEEAELVDPASDVERIVEEREDSRERENVLIRLKQEKRNWYDALILRYVGMQSDKEISAGKRIKVSLVGKWRQRAQEKLREWYREKDGL